MLGGRRISVCLARERFIIKEGKVVKGMRRSTLSRAVSCFFRALAAARNGIFDCFTISMKLATPTARRLRFGFTVHFTTACVNRVCPVAINFEQTFFAFFYFARKSKFVLALVRFPETDSL